jgi:hypothetical protein
MTIETRPATHSGQATTHSAAHSDIELRAFVAIPAFDALDDDGRPVTVVAVDFDSMPPVFGVIEKHEGSRFKRLATAIEVELAPVAPESDR